MASPLIAAKALENSRRWLLSPSHRERFRQIGEGGAARDQVTCRPEPLERTLIGHRSEDRDRPAPIRDFDRLTAFDAPKELTRPLSQLPNPHTCHVLLVAHR